MCKRWDTPGKWLAAELAGRAFTYTAAARMTMWSLTLPQVATTLAATLVAFHTYDPAGQRLLDRRMLDVVLALMCTTATLGPVLTQHCAPRMLADAATKGDLRSRGEQLPMADAMEKSQGEACRGADV
jgi:hypothetical protein